MSQSQLLRSRNFSPLFWTQFLGAFNDNFLKNALVILITFRSTSILGIPASQMVAFAGGIFILPFFLFSATAGQLADKLEKSQIIRVIKLAELGIMVLATLGFLSQQFSFLLGVLFLMGLHSTFFGPIKYSILPQHLQPDDLVGGNALIEAGTFLAILLGTLLGGVLVSGTHGAERVSAVLLGVAVLGYGFSRKIPRADPVARELRVDFNPFLSTLEILKTVRLNRSVFHSILGISWFWFFGASLLSLFPIYCKDTLHSDESIVTLFLALFSIGTGLGSLLCERLSRKRLELGLVPLGSFGLSVFTYDLFMQGSDPFVQGTGVLHFLSQVRGVHIALDLLFLSIFGGFFIVPLYTLMQERAGSAVRSRVIAANNILNALFMVIASLFLVLMMRLGYSSVRIFLVLSLLNGFIALFIYSLIPEFFLRFCAWGVAHLIYRLRVTGEEQIPKRAAALLVCNHVSFVDWLIISAAVQRPVRFVIDHTYAQGPLLRLFLKQAKVIAIAPTRENPELLKKSFDQISRELRHQEIVCIFPEGALTRTGAPQAFKPGVERILSDTPVTVVPMAIRGLWGSLFSRRALPFSKRFHQFWRPVELVIGAPVPPSEVTAAVLFERVSALRGDD